MRILRLHVDGFGCLHDRDFDFVPGLNLVLGPNEAGKSTLLHCLAQVLTGKPSKRTNFPDTKPWDGSSFSAWIICEQDGVQYKLLRRFAESGQKAVMLAKLADDGMETVVTQDAREVQKWLAAAFGTGDDTIFYKVFCLSQADLGPMADNADLHEQLERAISGGEVAVTTALQAVDGRLKALVRGEGGKGIRTNWGLLQKATDARDGFLARLQEARGQDDRLADARTRLDDLDAQRTAAAARITELTALLDGQKSRRILQKQIDEVQCEWEELETQREQVEQLVAARARIHAELAAIPADYADPTVLRERLAAANATRERQERYTTERQRVESALAALPAALADPAARATYEAAARKRGMPVGMAIAAAVLALLGIGLLLAQVMIPGLLLLVVGIALGIVGLFSGGNGVAALCRAWGVADAEEAERLLREAEALRQQLAAVALAADDGGATAPDVEEARRWLEQIEALHSALTEAEGSLKVLPTVEALVEQRRPLTRTRTTLEDQLADLPGTPLASEEEHRLTLELSTLQERRAGWEREAADLGKQIAVLESNARELIGLEDGHAYWQAEVERLQEEREVLAQAQAWLTEAGQRAHETFARPLEVSITPLFAAMTGGRYPVVHVRSNAKTLEIAASAGVGDVAFEQLSRGTRDQLVLAVRLALGEAIAGTGEPLYLLDDPLLHFDADRRREALAVLADFAARRQLILVTHDADLLDAGVFTHVIRCDALAATPA